MRLKSCPLPECEGEAVPLDGTEDRQDDLIGCTACGFRTQQRYWQAFLRPLEKGSTNTHAGETE
jgi:hypothetical protein